MSVGAQGKIHAQDDIAVFVRRVEDAGAVGEPAIGVAQVHQLMSIAVQRADLGDDFPDVFAVGSDVLHRSAADGSRDPAEAFDARKIPGDAVLHERVPLDSRRSRNPAAAFRVESRRCPGARS